MINFYIWAILGIISIILLIVFWRGRNAVWGSLTAGIIIGFIIAIVYVFRGDGFSWFIIGKAAIIGTMAGFAAELLGMVSDYFKNKK